jgi:hypothetical protein
MFKLKLFFPYILFISILFFTSCNSVHDIQSTLPSKINPNSCRINGTVIRIDSITEIKGPCSIHRCSALIEVNNVFETGFSFNSTIVKNDTIKVKFKFTLSKTSKDLFPNLNYTLLGLKVGDSFMGDVEKVELLKIGNKTVNFVYKIIIMIKKIRRPE